MLTIAQIAEVCYEANRAYCRAIGDNSQPPWEQAANWQRISNMNGVNFIEQNPQASASASHDSWLAEKTSSGWIFGKVKDPDKKEHPCCVPYDALPEEQKRKDYLFGAIVRSLSNVI